MRLRILAPDGNASERVVTAPVIRLGRDSACEVAFDPDRCPMVSGRHARIERTATGYVLTALSQSNKTLLNGQAIEGSVAVKAGDRIRLGVTGPTVEIVAVPPPSAEKPGPAPKPVDPTGEYGATAQAGPQHLALLRGSRGIVRMPIGTGGVIGRAAGQVEFVLDHPHVSRRHARLTTTDGRVLLHDLGSANGTFVNGRRVTRQLALDRGDRIDVGPFSMEFDGAALVSRSRSNNIELTARQLKRVVKDRSTGKPLTLLDDVSLVFRPREFVCLLGPSGSGKTTLLAMLSGRNPPDKGTVLVNGEDLYANFAAMKQDIAVVPQKDVLHDSLGVATALRFTAELRLPPDTSRAEVAGSVADILEVVGLNKRHGTLIRHLSGGQIKRASLANELMAKPSLLFLDEVTSGLDEQTDRDMMELFRQVADSGKTVVCITHSLANVEAACNLVAILTEGGRLAFVGTPAEARRYFGIDRLGEVYRKLAERPAADWQVQFKASPLYARYVRERLADQPDDDQAAGAAAIEPRTPVSPWRQARILMQRYVAIWRGDTMALLAMLGQALLVAVLLGAVFGQLKTVENPLERAQRTVNLLFLLNVSCFWFGCNNAAKELVKERLIYTRERDYNLRIDSYYASKLVVLVLIAVAQASLLFGVISRWCDPPVTGGWLWLLLVVQAVAGTALGLLISALAETEDVAAALVPIAVLPQLILAGVIAPVSGPVQWIARGLVTAYWSEKSLDSLLPADYRELLKLEQPGVPRALAFVTAHILVFAAAAAVALWRRDRSRGGRR